MERINKVIIYVFLILLIMFTLYSVGKIIVIYNNIELLDVKLISYDKESNTISIKISKKNNVLNEEFICIADDGTNRIEVQGTNNECVMDLVLNHDERREKTHAELFDNPRDVFEYMAFDIKRDVLNEVISELKNIVYSDYKETPISKKTTSKNEVKSS